MTYSRKSKVIILLLILVLGLSGCSTSIPSENTVLHEIEEKVEIREIEIDSEPKTELESELESEEKEKVNGEIEVHFIDVGQGDSILIKQGNNSMLIDAGEGYDDIVVNYIRDKGITKLDYIVASHPHADHIGGLEKAIQSFDVGKVIMPNKIHTTQTFERMLLAIQSKGLTITQPKIGDVYNVGEAEFTILGPAKENYSNLNNYSVVLRLEYGNNSFMLTGDAEKESELDLARENIKSDVLKVGHHGSDTSTIPSFLNKVDPKYAVIQVGQGNRYNHPDDIVLSRLKEKNIEVYRNDIHGTVIAAGDGERIRFETLETAFKGTVEQKSEKYIGNSNSKIFHENECSSLPDEKNRVYFDDKDKAVASGYRACKRCKP